jgi:apolipoprotein N-acyltransferase
MVFPWYTAHFALTVPAWAQLAEFGGPFILSAWLALTNVSIAEAWLSRRRNPKAAALCIAGAMALIVGVTLFGKLRMNAVEQLVEQAPTARLGIVQGNLNPSRSETRNPVPVYRDATLELLAREPSLDLLIWPEEAIYFAVPELGVESFLRDSISHQTSATIDAPSGVRDRSHPVEQSNSAVLVGGHGQILGMYSKRQLMPVGEYAVLPQWRANESRSTRYVPGPSDNALPLGSHRLGLSICYEDILHSAFRRAVAESTPDLLVNLTSDGWFQNSPGSGLHLTLAQLRAVEHRRFFVRATETGTTSVISPTGRILWSLPLDRRASGAFTIHWLRPTTYYERLGDWPWSAAVLAALGLSICTRRSSAAQPNGAS